jgi:hypothetical protein
MMSKRGQVTIFIVIGIILLAVTAVIFFFVDLGTKDQLAAQDEFQFNSNYVKSFIDNCLQESAYDAMHTVFSQGGYYQYPLELDTFKFVEEEEVLTLPVYFSTDQIEYPSLNMIETEVATATKDYLFECFDDFDSFKEQGYEVKTSISLVTVSFSSKTVISLKLPLTISDDDQMIELNEFIITVPFNFKDKYEDIEDYLEEQKKNPQSLLIGKLSSFAYDQNYEFSFSQFGNSGSDVLVDFVYENPLSNELLNYRFALNFDWSEFESQPEIELDIAEPNLILKKMELWNVNQQGVNTYQVEAIGNGLTYETSPDSLEINSKTGIITLDTKEFENDEYLYFVLVTDEIDNRVMGPFHINVNVNDGSLPIIKPIKQINLSVGENLYLPVKVLNEEDGPFTYSTEFYLFDIDEETGVINYTASIEDKGIHTVRVDVENNNGKTWYRLDLVIK